MITCPNCAHSNPETVSECEACYTPLPEMISCPKCNATISAAAHFCGQCGYDLQHNEQTQASPAQPLAPTVIGTTGTETSAPPLTSDPVVLPPDVPPSLVEVSPEVALLPLEAATQAPTNLPPSSTPQSSNQGLVAAENTSAPDSSEPPPVAPVASPVPASAAVEAATPKFGSTQLQQTAARLFHVQSNSAMELPLHLNVIHIGKPNGQIPPDIDLSGVADADIVSRVHADIRVEGDIYYLEDLGSSNGTYVNNLPLQPGNRHRLRPGDRIAFGKGDKVSFLFQLN